MAKVVPLSSNKHKGFKVVENAVLDAVKNQHIINIRVSEIAKASACMPVFLNQYEGSDNWVISSITSLEINKNLFISNGQWTVNYAPNLMKTYPFFLVKGKKEGEFTIGIDEEDKAFTKDKGVDIFDKDGNTTPAIQNVVKTLESDIAGVTHTSKFVETLKEFDLIYSLTMKVSYANGQVNSITGLHTVDERKLNDLSDKDFSKLRKTGFLGPIYGMILSVFQLNELMKRHNQLPGVQQIVQVGLQPDVDTSVEKTKASGKTVGNSDVTLEEAKKKALAAAKKKTTDTKKQTVTKKVAKKPVKKVAKKKSS